MNNPKNFWLKKRQVSQQSQVLTNKKLILQIIEESKVPLTPKQVHDKISVKRDIKPSTVRNYLRDLFSTEKVLQPYPGFYCNRVTYSVMVGELRVHNFRFCVGAPFLRGLGKFADFEEWTGDVKLRVQFGRQRRLISGWVCCDFPGVVKDTLLFALHRVLDVVDLTTGFVVSEGFTITDFESNKDYPGRRLDGRISCLSRKQLFGVIERFYQKEEDLVRCERKISRDMKVEEAVALLKRDLPDGNLAQGLFVLKERVEALTTCHKYTNREVLELNSKVDKLVNTLSDLVNRVSSENGVATGSVKPLNGDDYSR